jgi:tRNA nucleotidyltransferase (CCA-adding enzyme)
MPLSNTELRNYDSNVLRLPADKRAEYHEQVDRLIAELSKTVRSKTEINITKVVKAGSFAKYTILRKTSADPVDVDVVFYICGKSAKSETIESLSETLHGLLISIYPNKSVEDFEIQRKAATVTFAGSGLSVDVVPVIENTQKPGYGVQYDRDGSTVETCAPCQIKFVRDRKEQDSDFRTLVRLAKRWRNHAEIKPLKSFAIELIMAHILDKEGSSGTIEARFRNFLLYIAQSELKERITFPENTGVIPSFSDPVVIIDPVCNTNNVASRISDAERNEIVAAALRAWETVHLASVDDDADVWKEVFGPRFNTEASQ